MNQEKFNILPGIEPLIYGTNPLHRLIMEDDNIGENGENLTIVVLSCERAQATIKMMETIEQEIPNFKGIYLIADNGSSKETIEQLKSKMEKVPYKCEILEFGENLGVAKGRNEALKHVKTEWFMSLDNDILFATNPLPEIRKTISQLGCYFVNLPLANDTGTQIFSMGGNLFMEKMENGIHIGCGSLYQQTECKVPQELPRCLCSFVFGGASVISTEKFKECGGFDEGMFVGFEDIDFSIAVFKKGYKIGSIGLLAFIHDHKKPETKSDLEYEKQRFSNVKLLESAMYFEKKHNYKVWNEATEEWLREKEKQLGVVQEAKTIKENKKPVLSVVFSDDINIENIAKLQENFIVKPLCLKDIDFNSVKFLLAIQKSDITYITEKNIIEKLKEEDINDYIEKYQFWDEHFYRSYVDSLKILINSNKDEKWLNKEIKHCELDSKEISSYL